MDLHPWHPLAFYASINIKAHCNVFGKADPSGHVQLHCTRAWRTRIILNSIFLHPFLSAKGRIESGRGELLLLGDLQWCEEWRNSCRRGVDGLGSSLGLGLNPHLPIVTVGVEFLLLKRERIREEESKN